MNRTLPSLHGGSLEIMLTVPLRECDKRISIEWEKKGVLNE